MNKTVLALTSLLALGATGLSFSAGSRTHTAPVKKPVVEMTSSIRIAGDDKITGTLDTMNANPTMMVTSVAKIIEPNKKAAVFNAINCVGHVDLILKPMAANTDSFIKISRDSRQHIKFGVKNHVLYIKEKQRAHSHMQPVKLQVPVSSLHQLTVVGHVSVHAKNINTQNLHLTANTSGTVSLNGHVKISQLSAAGHSIVNLRWVDSKKLVVKTYGLSHVTLSGVGTQVWVNAVDHSRYNGQYLRSKVIYADTKNYASAKLLPVDSLFAYASGFSHINYYKKPHNLTLRPSESASISQVQWRK